MGGVHLVVDAANVVGSRPDGWWRDRAGAAARLVDSVVTALRTGVLDPPVTVVLEGAARAGVAAGPVTVAPEDAARPGIGPETAARAASASASAAGSGDAAGLLVVHADRDGDSAIVALIRALPADTGESGGVGHGRADLSPAVAVVTADRALGSRVRATGATVLPPSWLLRRLQPGAATGRHPDQ